MMKSLGLHQKPLHLIAPIVMPQVALDRQLKMQILDWKFESVY